MVKALPLLAILKIITTSGDFMQKKKTPNQQTSKSKQKSDTSQGMYVMYGFIKIHEYSPKTNRIRRETC